MLDPLAEVVALLEPTAPFSKQVVASAPWAVRRTELGQPFYLALLQGSCRLSIDGAHDAGSITLQQGDFVLIPAVRGFSVSSLDQQPPRAGDKVTTPITPMPGGARVGDPHGAVDVRMLVGHCVFGSPDAALLVPLLPQWIHVRADQRLATLMQLLADESRAGRPARDIVTARLLEVLLIEALRATSDSAMTPGLVQGLADPKLAHAIRSMHAHPDTPWNSAQLAQEAGMSRSAFFDRFSRTVGMAPMEYLMAWRMALAKRMLKQNELPMAAIAERIGYGSVSSFGAAFTRHEGVTPGRYARSGPAAAG